MSFNLLQKLLVFILERDLQAGDKFGCYVSPGVLRHFGLKWPETNCLHL